MKTIDHQAKQGNSQHYKLYLKQKYIWKLDKKTKEKDCVLNCFSEGKKYNPIKRFTLN